MFGVMGVTAYCAVPPIRTTSSSVFSALMEDRSVEVASELGQNQLHLGPEEPDGPHRFRNARIALSGTPAFSIMRRYMAPRHCPLS
jgi:hypothetical protein